MWEKLLLGGLVLLCDSFIKKKETKETTKSNDKDIDMKNIKATLISPNFNIITILN